MRERIYQLTHSALARIAMLAEQGKPGPDYSPSTKQQLLRGKKREAPLDDKVGNEANIQDKKKFHP